MNGVYVGKQVFHREKSDLIEPIVMIQIKEALY